MPPTARSSCAGENVTTGYFNAAEETARAFEDGWFHTGDIGEIGDDGQLFIRGRKKEMIVTPEGLNVFPEDVERVLNQLPGVRDSAVVGVPDRVGGARARGARARSRRATPDASSGRRTRSLPITRRIRRALVWPEPELPRTEGTRKLKRAAIRDWVKSGARRRGCVIAGTRRARGADREVRGTRRCRRRRRRSRSWD